MSEKKNIYDVIAWGRVVVQGKEFLLLSPRPYSSDVVDGGVGRSVWQQEGTLKWEVATRSEGEFIFERSIIVFGQDALIEFYQDPQTIKVNYIVPEEADDDVSVAPV
jgi:hypothetical protein